MTGYIATSEQPGTTALYRWNNPRKGSHFYTTDPTGELAPSSGYTSEGIIGYIVAPQQPQQPQQPETKALYRWYNPQSGDYFYTTDPAGEIAPSNGYISEGIVGYIAVSQASGFAPLYRWYNPQSRDYLYATDQTGEAVPSSGYNSEGVVGSTVDTWVM